MKKIVFISIIVCGLLAIGGVAFAATTIGTNITTGGTLTVGTDAAGTDVIFYSGTAGDNFTWDASEELLTLTGTNAQTALNVADGNVVINDNLTVSGTSGVTLGNGATLVNTSATLLTVTENNITLAATATTTASGDVYVTKSLKVGNGTPSIALASEAAYIEGALEVDGLFNLAGAATILGNLYVGGYATTTAATGNFITEGTVTSLGNFTVGSSKLVVKAASGNTVIQGTLTTGNISAYGSGDNANITINAKGTGTIGIGSVSTGIVTITPATAITGTLTVTGATDVSRFTQGGGILASSTSAATGVLTQANLATYSQLDYTPGDLAVTLTLPATSTLTTFIPTAGDESIFYIRNLDGSSATSTTIAAGTGITLKKDENGGDAVIEGGNNARLIFRRESSTDVTVYIHEYTN